jgi:hypothetical protein
MCSTSLLRAARADQARGGCHLKQSREPIRCLDTPPDADGSYRQHRSISFASGEPDGSFACDFVNENEKVFFLWASIKPGRTSKKQDKRRMKRSPHRQRQYTTESTGLAQYFGNLAYDLADSCY